MPPSLQTSPALRSLYRSLLREANKLPYEYLRVFFRLKFRDDIRSDHQAKSRIIEVSLPKRKRLERELRMLQAASSGNKKALTHVLDLAYGRRGKLKRELMEPFLTSLRAEKPAPIIRGVEGSRPPVYTPELIALLTSPSSRTTKPLKGSDLSSPPTLPSRANPKSKEAQLLGPFSKRREVNIRWRFFATEKRKVLPPFEVTLRRVSQLKASNADHVEVSESTRRSELFAKGLAEGGFQGIGLLHEIQQLAGVWNKRRNLTRRERKMTTGGGGGLNSEAALGAVSTNTTASSPLPTKFLRRRHRDLLRRVPLLTWSEHEAKASTDGFGEVKGKYEVSLPTGALSSTLVPSPQRLPLAGDCNMAWIQRAQEIDGQQNSNTKGKQ